MPEATGLPSGVSVSPLEEARSRLQRSSRHADSGLEIPGREDERQRLTAFITEGLEGNGGSIIYISGHPGMGKTATVQAVVAQLRDSPQFEFTHVRVNAQRLKQPSEVMVELAAAISPDPSKRPRPRTAQEVLTKYYSSSTGEEERLRILLVLDEADFLLTRQEDFVYQLCDWAFPGSRLIIVAIANVYNLSEKGFSSRLAGRFGDKRINFAGYQAQELERILESKLGERLLDQVLDVKPRSFCCKKVAKEGGDCRLLLSVMVRAIDLAVRDGDSCVRLGALNKAFMETTGSYTTRYLLSLAPLHKRILVHMATADRRDSLGYKFAMDDLYNALPGGVTWPTLRRALYDLRSMGILENENRRDAFGEWRLMIKEIEIKQALDHDSKP